MWSVWNGVDEIFSNKGIGEEKERIYIRGLGNSKITGGDSLSVARTRGWVISEGNLATCNGPISSLLNYTAKEDDKHRALSSINSNIKNTAHGFRVNSFGFCGLFCGANCRIYCAPRINVEGITSSFVDMFWENTNLKIAPLIEWDMDFGDCGMHWFLRGCINLETVPYISRKEDSTDPYQGFFFFCSSMKVQSQPTAECPNFFWNCGNNALDSFSYTAYWPNDRISANSGLKYYTNLKVMKRPEWPDY